MFSSIIFSSNLIILCFLLGLFYSLILYYKEQSFLSRKALYLLSFLRFFLISFLALLLLDPVVKSTTKIYEKPIVVILQDASQSINKNVKKELDDLATEFSDLEVYKYHFSDKIYDGFSEINSGMYTNYSNALNDIYSRFSNKNLSAVVFATDGMYNSGSNPLYSDHSNIPIHTICLGDTTILKDNRIIDIKHNDIVFLGNNFVSNVFIESDKFKGSTVILKIERKGELLFNKSIDIISDKEFIKVPLELNASEIGVQSYTAHLSVLDGEKLINNNSYNFYIDVVNSKYKILLLHDDAHPDIASFVSVVDKNKNYVLEVMQTDDFDDNFLDYNLVVLHSLSDKSKDIVESLSTLKIAILIFCKQDFNFYSSLMPRIKFKEKLSNNEVYATINNDFNSFKISNEIKDMIISMPPLFSSFGIYDISPSVNVMLNQRVGSVMNDYPICVFDDVDDRKVGMLIGEGFWKWRLQNFYLNNNNEYFNDLFNKITQFLLVKDDKSKFRLYYDKEINESNKVYFEAEVYNDSYELDNINDIELTITNKNKEEFKFLFNKYENKYFVDIGELEDGKYELVARVDKDDYIKKGSFIVKPVQIESLQSVADHQLLFNLSQQTNGQSFSVTNISELVTLVNNQQNNQTIISFEDTLKQIIDIKWILLVLLMVIAVEWFIRKFNGLI